jgi:shikimate kinase
MRVYLAGFMASGKSTVGPRLAERLGLGFLDLDDRIEAQAGQPIPDIFATEGEMGFRQRETRALWDTAGTDDMVVALGGGTIVDDANRAWAKDHGLVVTLTVPPETVLERVGDAAEHRPLLQDASGTPLSREGMRTRIERLLAERRPAYHDVHATVDADRPPKAVVDAVEDLARLWRHGRLDAAD